MDRYLIENGANDPRKHLEASIAWLKAMGGGTVVCDLKSNLMGALEMRDGEFSRYAERLRSRKIDLTWKRKGLPYSGNVVAAFTTRQVIEELDERDGIDALLVLGWSPSDYADWRDKHAPTLLGLAAN